jgi:hypothetical protein
MSDDALIRRLLLQVFGEQLDVMVSEWERLINEKDEIHYWLVKTKEAFVDELEKMNE